MKSNFLSLIPAQTQVNRHGPETPLKFVSENPTHVLASTLKNTPTYLNCHVSLKLDEKIRKDLQITKFYHDSNEESVDNENGDDDDESIIPVSPEEVQRLYRQQYQENMLKNKTIPNVEIQSIKRRHKRSSPELLSFEWFKNEELVVDFSKDGFTLFPNGTLKFQASNSTAGEYRCAAKHSNEKFTVGPIISQATVVEIASKLCEWFPSRKTDERFFFFRRNRFDK